MSLPIEWKGTKYQMSNIINNNTVYTKRYIEPFGGSGIVMLRRKSVAVETYNDLNKNLTNFFRILREHKDYLINELEKYNYSQNDLEESLNRLENKKYNTDLQNAVYFFISCCLTRPNTMPETSKESYFKSSIKSSNGNITKVCNTFNNRIEKLEKVKERFNKVQITNKDAFKLIKRHGGRDAMFYLDPPYISELWEGKYKHGLSRNKHKELLDLIKDKDGFYMISSYPNEIYNEKLENWDKLTKEHKSSLGSLDSNTKNKKEVIYCNYNVDKLGGKFVGEWYENPNMSINESLKFKK
jgi:DNA adenine methylase